MQRKGLDVMSEAKQRCKVLGRTLDGGLHIERPDGQCGVVKKTHRGQYISPEAEIVELGHAHSDDDDCAVELTTLVPARKGPSRVSTRRYRSGWDATFRRSTEERPN